MSATCLSLLAFLQYIAVAFTSTAISCNTLNPHKTAVMTNAKPGRLYGKLTYTGEQEKPRASIVFSTADTRVSMELFRPFQTMHYWKYGNDTIREPETFTLSTKEQEKIREAINKATIQQDTLYPAWSLILVQTDEQDRISNGKE